MKKLRLDKLLVERGMFPNEDAALRSILAREVKVDGAFETAPALEVPPDCSIEVKDRAAYVSRGGIKLRGALDAFSQDVRGLRCIDVGCSTGGFTDCLLQAGAKSVTCVDVGYGDLAWKLRSDPRTRVFERTNIRTADPMELGAPFDLAVADLSFIGLSRLAPVFAQLVGASGVFVGLVKPQFESRPEEVGEHGLVQDESVRLRTVAEVASALEENGFSRPDVVESSIKGRRAGNVEYLVRAVRIQQASV